MGCSIFNQQVFQILLICLRRQNHNRDYITPRAKRLAQSSGGQPGPVREMPMSTYDLSLLYSRSPLLQLRLRWIVKGR